MKQKLLSLLLTVVMLVGIMPTSAMAATTITNIEATLDTSKLPQNIVAGTTEIPQNAAGSDGPLTISTTGALVNMAGWVRKPSDGEEWLAVYDSDPSSTEHFVSDFDYGLAVMIQNDEGYSLSLSDPEATLTISGFNFSITMMDTDTDTQGALYLVELGDIEAINQLTAPADITYTVTFETNGGSEIDSVTATEGQTLSDAFGGWRSSKRDGYDFDGWYTTEDFSGPAWEWNISKITKDITLYAKWTKITPIVALNYTLTRDSSNGNKFTVTLDPGYTMPAGAKLLFMTCSNYTYRKFGEETYTLLEQYMIDMIGTNADTSYISPILDLSAEPSDPTALYVKEITSGIPFEISDSQTELLVAGSGIAVVGPFNGDKSRYMPLYGLGMSKTPELGGSAENELVTRYDITVQTEGSGTASASPTTAAQGTTIKLTATPDSGHHFKEWQVVSGGVTISNDEFTMPDGDVIVKAVFEADAPGHTHSWASDWKNNATHHWHECTASGCTLTDNSGKGDYGTHIDSDNDGLCDACKYMMDVQDVMTQIEQEEIIKVPDGLKNTEFDTVEEITAELSRVLTTGTGYAAENVATHAVTLQFSTDGGKTWIDATETNFPAEGITVILPYPDGTGKDTHDFIVTHMFTVTSAKLGTTAGETEQPKVTKVDKGLKVTLNGLSPVGIAWKAVNTDSDGDTDGGSNPNTGVVDSPKTGDNSNIALWISLMLASVCSLVVLLFAREKHRNVR